MQIKKHFKMNHVFFIQTRMVFKFLMINRRPLVLYISFLAQKISVYGNIRCTIKFLNSNTHLHFICKSNRLFIL